MIGVTAVIGVTVVTAMQERPKENATQEQERQLGRLPKFERPLPSRAGTCLPLIPDLPDNRGPSSNPETPEKPGLLWIQGLLVTLVTLETLETLVTPVTLRMVEILGQPWIPQTKGPLILPVISRTISAQRHLE